MKAPLFDDGRTCLHLAIEQEDLTSLHIIDFILANSSRGENCADSLGNTPLHVAALTDNPQCIKLLLNHNANLSLSECKCKCLSVRQFMLCVVCVCVCSVCCVCVCVCVV